MLVVSLVSDQTQAHILLIDCCEIAAEPDWLVHFCPSVLSYVVQISLPGSMEEGLNQIFADRAAAV